MTDTYVSIDLETTGLQPKTDRIIEVGAVKVRRGEPAETFQTFVNPGRQLEERVMELTHIRQEEVDSAPYMEEILPRLLDFLEDLPLLGHRVLFDYSFLKKAAVNAGQTFEKQGIDTLRIARRFLPELEHRSLEYLCTYYQIPHQAHRAYEDARATSRLYRILAEQFYEQEAELFQPRELHYAVKKDSPASKRQKQRLYELMQKHKIVTDFDMDTITRSEASRYTDKILAKYGR